jgi:molybdopterin converting factor subunit 1
MNRITVLFFATLKERAGVSSVVLELPPQARVQDLKTDLRQRFPGLEPSLVSVLVSINREFAFDEDVIPAQAEVALFPPVSGG